MNKLIKFGVASKDYETIDEARGDTYTARDNSFPSTRLNCDENPLRDRLKDANYILDFGCGVGRNLKWIMENTTAIYIGLDPNESMLKHFWDVQINEGYNVDVWKDRVRLVSDFDEIPTDIKFDYVVSTFVLQHLGYRINPNGGMDIDDITKSILSRMQIGGVFFAIEHDSEEPWIDRWLNTNNITPVQYIRSYQGLPELTHRDHVAPNGGHHLIIFEYTGNTK